MHGSPALGSSLPKPHGSYLLGRCHPLYTDLVNTLVTRAPYRCTGSSLPAPWPSFGSSLPRGGQPRVVRYLSREVVIYQDVSSLVHGNPARGSSLPKPNGSYLPERCRPVYTELEHAAFTGGHGVGFAPAADTGAHCRQRHR